MGFCKGFRLKQNNAPQATFDGLNYSAEDDMAAAELSTLKLDVAGGISSWLETDDSDSAVMDATYKRTVAIRNGVKTIVRKRISGTVKLSAKQITAPEDIIEVPMVGGIKGGTQQIPRFEHRGTCALAETVSGHARDLLERAQATRTVSQRPKFSGTIYHGTPDNHTQKWRIIDAQFFGFDPVDVDVENRGQLTVYSGQIFYMYFPGIE